MRRLSGICLGLGLMGLVVALEGMELWQIEPRHYIAYRTVEALEIDGKLDEPSWQRAPWTEAFVDIRGAGAEDTLPPDFQTRAKILWDDNYLYIAADLEEPHVWATLKERDAKIYNDNDFEVFIDPDGDTHLYYEFEINAAATEWDLLLIKPYRDGGPFVSGWDMAGLQTAVHVWGSINNPDDEDQGWSVEIAMPWKALRECAFKAVPPHEGDQWRLNFSRVQWDTQANEKGYTKVKGKAEDNWVWSPQGLVNMHYPEQWGYVQFSTAKVGIANEKFQVPPEQEARRILRRFYYQQRQYHRANGRYTLNLDSLGIDNPVLRDFLWPPHIEIGEHFFQAALEEVVDLHQDGKINRWLIRQDSRLWKE